MNDKLQNLINDCVSVCTEYRCSIESALDDLSWPTNGLGITEEEESFVRQQVLIELRRLRKWGVRSNTFKPTDELVRLKRNAARRLGKQTTEQQT